MTQLIEHYLLSVYMLVFYLLAHSQLRLDFASIYSSCFAYVQGNNPYQPMHAAMFKNSVELPVNLNPPIVLLLFSSLTLLPYATASFLWSLFSLFCAFIGSLISFRLCLSLSVFNKYKFLLLALYFTCFSTLVNFMTGQMGTLLFCLMMTGYYCYHHQKDGLAAILWALAIAFKIFPVFVLLFALMQKRYRAAFYTVLATLGLVALPLILSGPELYRWYFSMLGKVLWYGNNWNGSSLGFFFRVLWNPVHPNILLLIDVFYALFTLGILITAWTCLRSMSTHFAFAFTLIMMLLLSPLGWVYYFSLSLFPLLLLYQEVTAKKKGSGVYLFLLALFLINFPADCVPWSDMGGLGFKLGIASFYFYGLLLLAFLLVSNNPGPHPSSELKSLEGSHFIPVLAALLPGLIIPLSSIILRLTNVYP